MWVSNLLEVDSLSGYLSPHKCLLKLLKAPRWLGSQTGDDLDALEKVLEIQKAWSQETFQNTSPEGWADLIWEARFKYEELILLQDDSICEWHFKMQFSALYTWKNKSEELLSPTIDSGKYKFCYWRERLQVGFFFRFGRVKQSSFIFLQLCMRLFFQLYLKTFDSMWCSKILHLNLWLILILSNFVSGWAPV